MLELKSDVDDDERNWTQLDFGYWSDTKQSVIPYPEKT